jgi:hypothetical protein
MEAPLLKLEKHIRYSVCLKVKTRLASAGFKTAEEGRAKYVNFYGKSKILKVICKIYNKVF